MGFSHIFLFLSILPSLSTAESCSISKCINDKFSIRFPFRIPEQQPARCGYPGFNLACNKAGITTLNLYSSGQFYVRDIDYATQQIQLYDPEACLPRKLLEGFKISDSPFMPLFSQNFTFLSCPSQFAISRFPVLGCLSNSTNSVVATSSMSFVKSMSTACKIIATLPVPVSRPDEAEGFSSNLNGDLVLTWYSPACGICESEGRLCGYKNSNGQGITCYNYTTGINSAFCHYLQSLSLNYISHKARNFILACKIKLLRSVRTNSFIVTCIYHSWLRKSSKQIPDERCK